MPEAALHALDPQGLSDRTWRDLSLGDVFSRVDRCSTWLGKQTLYRRLRRGGADVAAFDAKVRAFDPPTAERFADAVKPLASSRASSLAGLLWGEAPRLPRGARFFPLATFATLVAAAMSFVWPVAILLAVGLVLGNIAIRLTIHSSMMAQSDALVALTWLVVAARKVAALDSPPLRTELAAVAAAVAAVAPWRRSLAWATLDARSLNELAASVVTYLNVFFLLDVNAFAAALRLLRERRAALQTLFTVVGELDVARSTAVFRAEQPMWSLPRLVARGAPILMRGMKHPLVDGAVANDVSIDERGWLVLGSNASGKSTCLKSIAVQAVLAQSIATTTCTSYEAPPLHVSTLIHVEDDLATRRSHFQVEAEAVRDMLAEAPDCDRLCIVDELFRGTNTVERVAAGSAVLRGLRRRGAHVVAATHDDELLTLLAADFDPFYFTERVEGGALTFDYQLHAGRAAPRNAIAVLELTGVPTDVVAEARALL